MHNDLDYYINSWEQLVYRTEEVTPCPPAPALFEGQAATAGSWIKFTRNGGIRPFYIWYVPSGSENAPLLLFLPGADGAIRVIPLPDHHEYGCVVVSPLGYGLPDGTISKDRKNLWVTTISGTEENYGDYLLDTLCVVQWALSQNHSGRKLILAGHSQGGGIALSLGAILKYRVLAVCADQPVLIGFSTIRLHDVLGAISTDPYAVYSQTQVSQNLSFIDPLRFVDRLTAPVLLVSGGKDPYSPDTVNRMFFNLLPDQANSRYFCVPERVHGYSPIFFQIMDTFFTDCTA